MAETRREQIFSGVVIAFLLLASVLDPRLMVAVAAGLLLVGAFVFRGRGRGLLAAAIAGAAALTVVVLVRILT